MILFHVIFSRSIVWYWSKIKAQINNLNREKRVIAKGNIIMPVEKLGEPAWS